MQQQLQMIIDKAKEAISTAADSKALEQVRVDYLGKKGKLTALLKSLGSVSAAERPKAGQAINQAKQVVQAALGERQSAFKKAELDARLAGEKIDVTLPGRKRQMGHAHPITQTFNRVVQLLESIGFRSVEGGEIEQEQYNFTALNMPADHPARAMQDTFYIDSDYLLRTHTSPLQIRTMLDQGAPLRVIAPGRVYRRDSDQTHTPMFHQIEGLVVDKACSFAELKSLLQAFLEQFFGESLTLRFRPSYFPFTEPSAEVDVCCTNCSGQGCRICSDGWIEVLGCGMVHPNVLRNVNLNPDEYIGYAFGVGIDRLAMLYYQVPDLRLFFDNNINFLRQF